SPMPVYKSTRDTRNSPLWNPTSKELLNVEDDEAGRLAGFRARFGTGFDTVKEAKKEAETEGDNTLNILASVTVTVDKAKTAKEPAFKVKQNIFEEDDINLLDSISSF
ncbi:hypothetical protein A1O1_00761, partial [Capronia coronata CBS 617.96]